MKATRFLTLSGSNAPHRSSSLHPSVTSYSLLRRPSYVPLRLSCTVHAGALASNPGSQGKPMDDNEYIEDALKFVTLFPLEENYKKELKKLLPIFSKYGFFRNRMIVQVEWLLKQSDISEIKEVPKFSQVARDFLKNVISKFSESDMSEVKNIEYNSIGAVLNFLKEISKDQSDEISKVLQNYEFTCTPEVINLAYGMMLSDAINEVYPVMTKICETLFTIMEKKKNEMPPTSGEELPFPATELSYKIPRLLHQAERLREIHISGQFKGEGGNDNPHRFTNIDWPRIAEEFVTSLGLKFQPNINPENYICMLYDVNAEFNKDVKDYICLLYGTITEFNSFLTDISLKLMVKEGDKRKINFLSEDHRWEFLERNRPFTMHTRHPFVLDLVGVIGYSFVGYQGMLEELEKLL